MKKIIFLLLSLVTCLFCLSQTSVEGLRGEMNTLSKYSSATRGTGYENLQSFSSIETKGSQFYYPMWLSGSIITQTDSTDATDYMYLYDKVRQVLFIKAKNSDNVLEVNKDKIHGFNLQNAGLHTFLLASKYMPADKTGFYEILVKNDSGYTLLKSVTTKFVKFDEHDMVRMKNGETNDSFEDEISYYLSYKGGMPQALKIKDASINKALGGVYRDRADTYMSQHLDDTKNEEFLANVVRAANQ